MSLGHFYRSAAILSQFSRAWFMSAIAMSNTSEVSILCALPPANVSDLFIFSCCFRGYFRAEFVYAPDFASIFVCVWFVHAIVYWMEKQLQV